MPKIRRRPAATDRRFRKPLNSSDFGPPERWQHSGRLLEQTEKPGHFAARATEEHVVDVLVLRGVLDVQQSAAAFKFEWPIFSGSSPSTWSSSASASVGRLRR